MAAQLTYTFSVPALGSVLAATLATRLAAVPIDNDTLQRNGLRLISDATATAGTYVTRTIVVGMGPTTTAVPLPTLDSSKTPSSIIGYTLGTNNGIDYIRPPIVSIADATGSGAAAYAQLGVYGTTLGGAEATPYSAATTVTASGGQLAPGGKQATFGVTIVANAITAVNVVTNGGPYNVPPTLTITDPGGGSGQTVTARLGVSALVPTAIGKGYTNPAVTLTPYFKGLYPDGSGTQPSSIQSWMQDVIQKAMNVSIVPTLGVVA